MHTYRGRQGADVALLIRRIKAQCQHPLIYIGTSTAMISGGTIADQQHKVADVASEIFGEPLTSDQLVIENLRRTLQSEDVIPQPTAVLVLATQN